MTTAGFLGDQFSATITQLSRNLQGYVRGGYVADTLEDGSRYLSELVARLSTTCTTWCTKLLRLPHNIDHVFQDVDERGLLAGLAREIYMHTCSCKSAHYGNEKTTSIFFPSISQMSVFKRHVMGPFFRQRKCMPLWRRRNGHPRFPKVHVRPFKSADQKKGSLLHFDGATWDHSPVAAASVNKKR